MSEIIERLKGQPILVYDLETRRTGDSIDGNEAEVRVFGCYSYLFDTYKVFTNKNDMKNYLDKHKYLVGFNTLGFDNLVLSNDKFFDGYFRKNFNRKTKETTAYFLRGVDIDLRKVLKDRASSMKIKEGMLKDLIMSYSLDFITQLLGLVDENSSKMDFDYELLQKDYWTREEQIKIKEYTLRDIEITKKLYEWIEEYFDSFKSGLSEKDILQKKYITTPPSVYAYKIICNRLNWSEDYNYGADHERYDGGYVSYPAGERFVNQDILCFDFNSLYPHIFIQCNLFSKMNGGWHGGHLFKTVDSYDDKTQGIIEKELQNMYNDRAELKKKGDPREYSLKIVLNTLYGLTGNETFVQLYKPNTAGDCTRLARDWIFLARKMFRDNGFSVVYSDTDSVYVINHHETRDKILAVKDDIVTKIKSSVPFPADTFDMGIDDEIYGIFFFKGKSKDNKDDDFMDEDDIKYKPLGFMKKNYIYVAKDDKSPDGKKVVIKNLGIRKKSSSPLSKELFKNVLIPKIKSDLKVKFPKRFFKDYLSRQPLDKFQIRFSVNNKETYKLTSSIQYQIAEKYGSGVHYLIPNTKFGIGKDKKYCTIEEFRKNKLRDDHIIYDGIWNELEYFIEPEKVMTIKEMF